MNNLRCLLILSWISLQLGYIHQSDAFTLRNNASHLGHLTHVKLLLSKEKKTIIHWPLKVARGGGNDVQQPNLLSFWAGSLKAPKAIGDEIRSQFRQRVAADPEFVQKSVVEIIFAILMQFAAEVSKRGANRILPEIDFVVAGIFTAMVGKYYSMWRVAKTLSSESDDEKDNGSDSESWKSKVPTNAFQDTLVDGKTKPTFFQRVAAFIVPIPSLFQAGFIASAIGYGFTAILISLRSIIFPSYVAATVNVNIPRVCLYVGAFVATVSNIRYQVLQGLIEPKIDKLCEGMPTLQTVLISFIRLVNGLLGSYLAITGMRLFGLQKLK